MAQLVRAVYCGNGTPRLLSAAGFEVVGQAGDAEELLLKIRSYQPDIAIVGIRMPLTHTDAGPRAAKGDPQAVSVRRGARPGKLRLGSDAGAHRRVLAVLAFLRA